MNEEVGSGWVTKAVYQRSVLEDEKNGRWIDGAAPSKVRPERVDLWPPDPTAGDCLQCPNPFGMYSPHRGHSFSHRAFSSMLHQSPERILRKPHGTQRQRD